jgi:UDP-N-acetylglucosamine 2-epimerase (non-hydrolysing)
MKPVIILGTRPEIIKMSPIIHRCEQMGIDYNIIHTGQHYSYNMDKVFFDQLELPRAKYNLDIGSGSHGEQTGKMLVEIEKVLQDIGPDVVLVEGDTNTVLAGALAASKLHIKVGHVEAGLRSFDRNMPEEINRELTDHCSDYLFAPTEKSKENLIDEGISGNKIFVTGNTVVDAVNRNLRISKEKVNPLKEINLEKEQFFLVTIHRQENVDNKLRFGGILRGLELIANEYGLPILYPIHPRAKKMMMQFGLTAKGIRFIEPVDYLSFLQLESKAKLVLTDSGGVQEETCILGVPCVTVRDNTERPETLDVGANLLAGTTDTKILKSLMLMLEKDNKWENPFGNGKSGELIIDILQKQFT